jgi:hypothetical protein
LALFTWNAPEFRIEKTRPGVSVRIASPRFSESYTYLFASFVEGALETFDYKIVTSEVKQGIIRFDAVKEAEVLG